MLAHTKHGWVMLCSFCATDVANLISKTLEVDSTMLTAVLFTQYGMTIAWRLQGSTANELSYTVRLVLKSP
jgi:hypothetical protein